MRVIVAVVAVAVVAVVAVLGVGLDCVLTDEVCLKSWLESIDLVGDGGSVVMVVEEASDFGDMVSCREISWMGDSFGLVLVESVFRREVMFGRGRG